MTWRSAVTSRDVPQVRDLRSGDPGEIDAAVGVLSLGMRDNPLHVAAYGTDPDHRLRCHARLMRGLFTAGVSTRHRRSAT